MMHEKTSSPLWALDQKCQGTELRCIRGKYSLYECSSFYDKEKMKTRKKTGAYLGMVIENRGLMPPRRRQVEIVNKIVEKEAAADKIAVPEPKIVEVKEYGHSTFISAHCTSLTANLKSSLPSAWNRALAMAFCRVRTKSSLKYIHDDFSNCYLSQTLGIEELPPHSIIDLLKSLGKNHAGILDFMLMYAGEGGNVIFDGTEIMSASAKMDFQRMSKTKLGGFAEAVNLMIAFSTQRLLMVYYCSLAISRISAHSSLELTSMDTCRSQPWNTRNSTPQPIWRHGKNAKSSI